MNDGLSWSAATPVTVEVVVNGSWHVVDAEVTRLAPDDYVVLWANLEAVQSLGFSCARLSYLVNRCEEQCRWLEWEREAEGIATTSRLSRRTTATTAFRRWLDVPHS